MAEAVRERKPKKKTEKKKDKSRTKGTTVLPSKEDVEEGTKSTEEGTPAVGPLEVTPAVDPGDGTLNAHVDPGGTTLPGNSEDQSSTGKEDSPNLTRKDVVDRSTDSRLIPPSSVTETTEVTLSATSAEISEQVNLREETSADDRTSALPDISAEAQPITPSGGILLDSREVTETIVGETESVAESTATALFIEGVNESPAEHTIEANPHTPHAIEDSSLGSSEQPMPTLTLEKNPFSKLQAELDLISQDYTPVVVSIGTSRTVENETNVSIESETESDPLFVYEAPPLVLEELSQVVETTAEITVVTADVTTTNHGEIDTEIDTAVPETIEIKSQTMEHKIVLPADAAAFQPHEITSSQEERIVTEPQVDSFAGNLLMPENVTEHDTLHEKKKDNSVLSENQQVGEIESTESVKATRPRVQHRKIYGEQTLSRDLMESTPFRPLTIQQLQSLYYNPQLAQNEAFVESFVQTEMKKEHHEFYEILMDYYRARVNFLNAESDIQTLQKNYHSLLENLWVTSEHTVSAQGYCGDNVKCTTTHMYNKSKLNDECLQNVSLSLQAIRTQLHEQFSLHAYSAQLSRFQVESYIHNLFMDCPVLRDIPRNAPVQAALPEQQNQMATQQINRLKDCITILFMFHRRPIKDEHFIQDIRAWTERLTSALLRVASFRDHLFILNHILRCPAGVGKWAAKLVQIPAPRGDPTQPSFGNPVLDHVITMLSIMLLPVRGRSEFMCQMNVSAAHSGVSAEEKENLWILVDSDGEEDEDPSNSWLYLHENDLVSLLQQFPSPAVFRHVFLMDHDREDASAYDVQRTGDSVMIKVFAFSTCLIDLLSSGLQTFSLSRYRQLNKRLGRMIRQTVHYVSCHWQNFKTLHHELSCSTIQRIQLEFDQFFLRATHAILAAEKLGSWQFMADMPFLGVSVETMWKLLWILHQSPAHSLDLDMIPDMHTCIQYLKDPDNVVQFADNLVKLPTSESIYLLTTFSNMAQSRPKEERTFVEVVVLEVFEIAYISSHTRDFCSKVGRELLSAIGTAHAFVVSIIIQRLKEVMDEIGMMCIYLFREMPLYLWRPSQEDVCVLGEWLLTSDLSRPQNHLARLALSDLNWGFTKQEDKLLLSLDLHRQVALLLVQAFAKFVADKNAGFAVLQGMKQVASVVRNQMTNEQQFNIWIWDLALRLHLHRMSLPSPGLLLDMAGHESSKVPDVENDSDLLPLQKALRVDNSMACYISLAMTKYGHSMPDFTSTGLNQLTSLSNQNQHQAVLKILSHIVPMFYQSSEYLLENDKFLKIVRQILTADDTYLKFAKSILMNTFPGETIKLFANMIQTQVSQGSGPNGAGGTVVIMFWLTLLTKTSRWHQDRNCCYLLDNLIRSCFSQKGGLESVKDLFNERFTTHVSEQGGHGMMSSLVSWIASGASLPSFIERSSSEFPWLAYIILEVEGQFEHTSKLWKTIQQELISDPSSQVEQAVKKAATRLKLPAAPAIHRMNIYRWAQQALDTPLENPLLIVFWQRFFILFLGRLTADAGMPQRASIGEKFFESMSNVSMMKRMKKRLAEAAEYHHWVVPVDPRSRSQSNAGTLDLDSDSEIEDTLELTAYIPNQNFHHRLASLYRTFLLWVDEPRLHDASLYLPSLPPQYDANRLQRVFHNNTDPWLEFVDLDRVEYELSQMVSDWVKRSGLRGSPTRSPHINMDMVMETATDEIMNRLRSHDVPVGPPPVAPLKPPVPDISVQVLEDKQAILYILNGDLNTLKDFSKLFMTRMSKHMALDCNYLELLPEEFYNQRRQVTLTAECRKTFSPTHKCKQPAVFQAVIEEKSRNEMVERRLDENRAEYKQVMIEALLPPPSNICMAAVHVENVIVLLVKLCQTSSDQSLVMNLQHIASTLFYHLASMINDETNFYPPTRQFFSSCVEILGQEFIRYNHDQVYTLLEFALGNPTLAGLLSPHFCPNHSPQYFVSMYEQISKVPLDKQPEMAFTFLSKFDVVLWLSDTKPPHGDVTQYLLVLSAALCSCGPEPNTKSSMMLEVYCSHLEAVLKYRFPDYLEDILKHLLEGSTVGKLNPRCWEMFCLTSLGKPRRSSSQLAVQSSDQSSPPAAQSQVSASLLSITQIQRLLEWLANYFTRLRTTHQELASFGLYPKWRPHSFFICEFLRDLIKDLAVKLVLTVVDWSPQKALEFVWHHLTEAFCPWIQPLDNQPEILTPWVENDTSVAMEIVAMFQDDIEFIHNHFSGSLPPYSSSALSLLWTYYADKLSRKGTPDFVLHIYHSEFERLPWESMQPSCDIVSSMSKLKESSCDESFLFLSRIFPRVNWSETVNHHIASCPAAVTAVLESGLFKILLQFYAEKELVDSKDGGLVRAFFVAETFNWSYLVSGSFCDVTNWLLQNCDPACILAERSSNAALGPRLMKSASGFNVQSSVNWQPDMSIKRVNYVHCLGQLLCQCTFLPSMNTESFSTVLINLLTEIETVEGAVADTTIQQEESLDLIKEIFSLLNNSNPDSNSIMVVMATIVQWLQSSPNSLLLMPCLKASSRSLASLSHIAQIAEVCIETHFSSMFDANDVAGWGQVLATLQIPELSIEEYFRECLQTGSYLTLYSYILQQVPLCQGLVQEQRLITLLTDWISKAKPSSENEAKLILWCYKFLELLMRQVEFGTSQGQCVDMINRLVPSLTHLGEDRVSTGILGAIGFGRKSALSHKVRVFSRAIAAFLMAQIQGDATLRLQSGVLQIFTQQAKIALASLQSIRNNKEYGIYRDHVEFAHNFVLNQSNTLRNGVSLVVHLAHSLYPGQGYLNTVQHI